MKKNIFWIFLVSLLTGACSDDIPDRLNGYWQLKDITNAATEEVTPVDSVFYSFQHERLFSFTVSYKADSSRISYGTISFPEENIVQITMDTILLEANGDYKNVAPDFLQVSGWESHQKAFFIDVGDKKRLKLYDDKNLYSFKKY